MRKTGRILGFIAAGIYAAFTAFYGIVLTRVLYQVFSSVPQNNFNYGMDSLPLVDLWFICYIIQFTLTIAFAAAFCVFFVSRLIRKPAFSLRAALFFPIMLYFSRLFFATFSTYGFMLFNVFDSIMSMYRVNSYINLIYPIAIAFTAAACMFLYNKNAAPGDTCGRGVIKTTVYTASIGAALASMALIAGSILYKSSHFYTILLIYFGAAAVSMAVGGLLIYVRNIALRKNIFHVNDIIFYAIGFYTVRVIFFFVARICMSVILYDEYMVTVDYMDFLIPLYAQAVFIVCAAAVYRFSRYISLKHASPIIADDDSLPIQ